MKENLHKGASPKLFQFARQNRRTQTAAEKLLWDQLRNRRFKGQKFRRQHPIADFIVDFFCLESNLVIEVDGEYHNEENQKRHDDARARKLAEQNINVIRFTNQEILETSTRSSPKYPPT